MSLKQYINHSTILFLFGGGLIGVLLLLVLGLLLVLVVGLDCVEFEDDGVDCVSIMLYSVELEATELDATELDATELDATELDATELDSIKANGDAFELEESVVMRLKAGDEDCSKSSISSKSSSSSFSSPS